MELTVQGFRGIIFRCCGHGGMADTKDLKSFASACGFNSRCPHHRQESRPVGRLSSFSGMPSLYTLTLRYCFACLQPAIVLYAYSCHCLARLYAAITLLAYTPLSLYTLTLRYRFAYLQPAIVLHTYSRHCLSRLFPPLPCSPILRYRFVCFQTAALYQ